MLISICIPAYKRIEYVKRLLDSISIQTFRDFEVIVTDDSDDNQVEDLCRYFSNNLNLLYYRNTKALGTPENWNQAIRLAKGEWIKLMHDDDWFVSENSLEQFVRAIDKDPECGFFFSRYKNFYFEKNSEQLFSISPFWLKKLRQESCVLFSRNVIGAPSVTLVKRSIGLEYDRNLKWLVDIEFYIRLAEKTKLGYIDQALIYIGIGKEQVTQDCFRQRPIEIPENFYVLNKVGLGKLKNVIVYDAFWRLLRNLEIRKEKEILESGYDQPIPLVIKNMLQFQNKIPLSVLKIGFLSKFFMFISFLSNSGNAG